MTTVSTRIHVLSDHVINKIAAGEVVERPASVVKELMENALDAGATQVDVEIEDGGRALVSVSDNGCGMSHDDALLAIERHATSKIQTLEDIERIGTLGFRGEALAAIAAVSRFRLCTRPAADLSGTEIRLAAGKLLEAKETGCAPGTTVEVRNLFFNVPARKKFLRSATTETDHVRQVFVRIALARAVAGFTLTADRRRIYTAAAQAKLSERLQELFPWLDLGNLRAVEHTQNGVRIYGYAGLPALSRSDRDEQYVFVNERPAWAPVLHAAIRSAYQGLLPADRQPVLFLFVQLDCGMVDVNVHPAKKEVRFRDPTSVRDAMTTAIRRALAEPAGSSLPAAKPVAAPEGGASLPADLPPLDRFLKALPGLAAPFSPRPSTPSRPAPISAAAPAFAESPSRPNASQPDVSLASFGWYRLLGAVGGRYAVLETKDGLALLDPHAAHERVLYERLRNSFQKQSVVSQPLLLPVSFTLPLHDAARVRRCLDLFRRLGFGLADFGGDAFVIDALPAGLDGAAPAELIAEIAGQLEAGAGGRHTQEELILRAACRAAVKAGQAFDEKEIRALLEQLLQAEMPYTCPHGRPTLIYISLRELDRKFGRT